MSYQKMKEQADQNEQTQDLTPTFIEWKNEGQEIVGKFVGVSQVQSSLGSGTYNQYLFETDEGLVKFAMGGATDKEVSPLMETGAIYVIQYQGKTKISGGRQVNQFNVKRINIDETSMPSDNESKPV